jgi:hypothetical protein
VAAASVVDATTARYTLDGFEYDGAVRLWLDLGAVTDPWGNPAGTLALDFSVDAGRALVSFSPSDGTNGTLAYSSPPKYRRLLAPGEVRHFIFRGEAGRAVTATAAPTAELNLVLTLRDASGTVIAASQPPGPGRRAVLRAGPLAQSGNYEFTVRDADGGTGRLRSGRSSTRASRTSGMAITPTTPPAPPPRTSTRCSRRSPAPMAVPRGAASTRRSPASATT